MLVVLNATGSVLVVAVVLLPGVLFFPSKRTLRFRHVFRQPFALVATDYSSRARVPIRKHVRPHLREPFSFEITHQLCIVVYLAISVLVLFHEARTLLW